MSTATPEVKLCLSFGNATQLALSIPLDKCGTFAVNPLKWLRFLGFAIYGREGYLSISKAGPEIEDYTADIEPRSYHFVAESEARLVDADVMDDRTSNASNLTAHRNDFRTNVIERDGTCVITDELVSNCTACHIIPHAKRRNYISNVVRHRSGTDDSADDIDDINDTRNGLLLSNLLHQPFRAGKFAFLKTPNFALTVDDIPYQPPRNPDQESPASRLTLQHFVNLPQLGPVIPIHAPQNFDARQPQDTSEWPPAVIVDLFYAAAALNAWGPKPFIEYVREQSRDAYYSDDGDDQDDDGSVDASKPSRVDARMGNQTAGQSESGRYALRSRNQTSTIPSKERRFADLMDGVSALWMQSSKLKPEDVHASSLGRSEGVRMWLQSMENPMTN